VQANAQGSKPAIWIADTAQAQQVCGIGLFAAQVLGLARKVGSFMDC